MYAKNGEGFPPILGVTLVDWPDLEDLQVVGQGSKQRVVGKIAGGLLRVEDCRPGAIKAAQAISHVNNELAVLAATSKPSDSSWLTEYGAKNRILGEAISALRRQYDLCAASIEVTSGQGGGLVLVLGENASEFSRPFRRAAFLPLKQMRQDLPAYDYSRTWTIVDKSSDGTFARIFLQGNQLIVFAIFDQQHSIWQIRQFRLTNQHQLVGQFEVEVAGKERLGYLIRPFTIGEAWGSLRQRRPEKKSGMDIMSEAVAAAATENGGSLLNQSDSTVAPDEVAEAEKPKVKRQRKSRTQVLQEEKPVAATDEPSALSNVD